MRIKVADRVAVDAQRAAAEGDATRRPADVGVGGDAEHALFQDRSAGVSIDCGQVDRTQTGLGERADAGERTGEAAVESVAVERCTVWADEGACGDVEGRLRRERSAVPVPRSRADLREERCLESSALKIKRARGPVAAEQNIGRLDRTCGNLEDAIVLIADSDRVGHAQHAPIHQHLVTRGGAVPADVQIKRRPPAD